MKEEEEVKDPREALRAFVIESKVDAFARMYIPCYTEFGDGVVSFSDADLRKFFDAYPRTMGDPLAVYLDEYLAPRGYKLTVSQISMECVMLVYRRR